MSAIISESYVSRPFTVGVRDSGRELIFDIQGAANESEVLSVLEATVPASYLGLLLDSLAGEPVSDTLWKGTARYVRLEDGNEYTFDTSGGTQHLTQSLSTIGSYAASGFTAPDFQGAIGVSEDRVEGVDITAPKFDFSETHIFENSFVDLGYKQLLVPHDGHRQRCQLQGAGGRRVPVHGRGRHHQGRHPLVDHVPVLGLGQCHRASTIGDITDIDKDGWDYLWLRYSDFEDSGAKLLVKRPVSCFVERVYRRADFSTLLIGT